MKPARVLTCAFVCCPPGKPGFTGGESLLGWNLLNQIARFHQVWAITNGADRPSLEQALAENPVQNLQFAYVTLPAWLRVLLRFQGGHQFYYYLWQVRAYFTARRLHQRLKFDLFHHITYANDWMASLIGAMLAIPYVRGPGGGAHATPQGLIQEYSVGGQLWERVRAMGQQLLRLDPFFLKGQGRASALLLCNQESISNVPSRWSHKVHPFPVNGISRHSLPPLTFPSGNGRPFRVLSAGSLIKVKGFALAIKAFKGFADQYPESEMLIIGKGPELPRLRDLVGQLQLNDKVKFTDWVPQEELLSHMSTCDVFLFPSLRDGGGSVVVEAMGVGRPVLCLDIGGPGVHVTPECGIKISPGGVSQTVNELTKALKRLYEDPDLRQKLGRAARDRAEQLYDWDGLGRRLMDIYSTCLSQNHAD